MPSPEAPQQGTISNSPVRPLKIVTVGDGAVGKVREQLHVFVLI